MIDKLFSGVSREGAFFRRVDWTAFWAATVVSLLVYFFTLGPSVTLEDSGELAVAGDHLGVPHPPGYPIWTMCAYVFARLFSWVTYQGQPTPSWSISLMSAVFAALAAGLTAMLITRSASDMVRDAHDGEDDFDEDQSNLLCWAGGVGGSLVFAFSPVMWSQATIVEVYTLNAFFLMWIFLLTYRWMRKPSAKILWLTAFVFGLGLTNYQVLLLAAVPLAVVIFLRDLALFRDFLLVGIPVVLTAHVLQIGSMIPAQPGMAGPAYAKAVFPNSAYIITGMLAAAVTVCCAVGAYLSDHWKDKSARPWLIASGVVMMAMLFHIGSLKGAAMPYGYAGEPFSWALPGLLLVGGLSVLFLLACTVPRGLFYALPVAAVQLAVFVMLRKGGMNGLTHPSTWWFWWGIIWNFAIIGLAWLALPHGKTVALTALFAELGVSFYIYMPIVSDLRNPPMNWGYPRTWEGFKHAIMRGQYEKIAPSDVFTPKFLFQLGAYFTDLRTQFTLLAATLGFIPFTLWSVKAGGRRIRAVYAASGLYLLICVLVILSEFTGGEPVLRLDKVLLALLMLPLFAGGIAIVWRQIEAFAVKTWKTHNLSESLTAGLVLAGVAAAVVVVATLAAKMGIAMLNTEGTVWQGLGILLGLVLLVAFVAGIKFAEKKFDFRFDTDDVSQQWLISTAAGFLVMSVLLVALANIKGDLQDMFIQKVKFISSHGLFAVWIGYGLTFGLVVGNRLLKALAKRGALPENLLRPSRTGMICAGLLIAAIPIYENYTNEYLVFSMSGAEQNGHDFGWQFGNYQLRGADSITEELEADEEPLPNPLFPLEMEPNAIFFGGTDPGRFVPTYMIYSAMVRPDVFLITQNALADNTYMNTMRDLYGNPIWIPTPDDSAKAFQVYVDEVQTGKRPKNADLTIENGRVQVSGALGVMEINGILCDMIFQKNKARHAFYIEESYVINWMFPYLTPHGLIMKINSEKTPLDHATVRNDMQFWDWYTRHLLRSPMFRRDLPAQKSFSKLRSAIAGLYAARYMQAEAERAFQEARVLYPVSPEANFRLIQEVLLRQGRYTEAIDVLDEYNFRDPNNGRGKDFVNYIRQVRATEAKVRELGAKAQANKGLDVQDAYELALAYRDLGQNDPAAMHLNQLATLPNLPPERLYEIGALLSSMRKFEDAAKVMDSVLARASTSLSPEQLLDIARIYGQAGDPDKMQMPLSRYLQLRPNDWRAWLDMALLRIMKQQRQEFQFALQKALELGRHEALQHIQENEMLRQAAVPILQQMQQQRSAVGGLPGLGPRGR